MPVVHGANRMTAEQLAVEIERLTTAARTGTLAVADLTGSTFTLNNYGVYGVDGSTPILNHPEAAMSGSAGSSRSRGSSRVRPATNWRSAG